MIVCKKFDVLFSKKIDICETVASIKKKIKEHEWSVEELEDVLTREALCSNRKLLVSFLKGKIQRLQKRLSRSKDRHTSKADRHISKVDRHTSKADRHSSTADRHTSTADRHISKADRHTNKVNTSTRDFWWEHREVSAVHACMCMAHEAASSQHWTEKEIKQRCVPLTDMEMVKIVNTFHKKMEKCLDTHVCGVCGEKGSVRDPSKSTGGG